MTALTVTTTVSDTQGNQTVTQTTAEISDFVLGITDPATGGIGPAQPTTSTVFGSGTPASFTVSTPGAVFENVRFECLLTVQVANVTFRNCEFVGPSVLSAQPDKGLITAINGNVSNLLVERCLFRPQTPVRGLHGIIGHDYTLLRCDMSRVEDGTKNFNASGPTDDLTIHGNWIRDLLYVCPNPNQSDNRTHNDCVQISGSNNAKNISIVGNRLEAFLDTQVSTYFEPTFDQNGIQQSGYQYFSNNGAGGPGGTWTTSAVMLSPTGATPLDNVLIDKNWIDGGFSASINCGGWTNATNINITNNRWGRDQRLGSDWHIIAKAAQPLTITGNVYEDDGTPDNGRKNG